MITANKGEWSELYALLKILGDKKLYAGDGQLNRLETYYPVIKVIRDELEQQKQVRHMEYSIDNDIVIVTENCEELSRINVDTFLEESQNLFAEIAIGKNHAFAIPTIDDFLKKIHCEKIKAKSTDKSDIHIVIHDYHTGMTPELGFSIKSSAGSAPTLLNASSATNFIYRLDGLYDEEKANRINSISSKRKLQDRVAAIVEAGATPKFVKVQSQVFHNNLTMISDGLPQLLADMLWDSYEYKEMDIVKAVKRATEKNFMNYDLSTGHDFYGYKLKSLMVASALGMLPATPWTGRYEATGGYIVVKDDGDIVCFHIYDRNLLEDYLFYNTKFETADARWKFGNIYKGDDGAFYFALNLQIRFKK